MMNSIFTVSKFNDIIKGLMEGSFEQIWIEGEVSNVSRPASGHIYFTLKDESSQIRAVVFRRIGQMRSFLAITNGEMVLCRARLNLYKPRGEYHLVIETVEPRGLGVLQKLFTETKARLAQEGLFDAEHKKNLPLLPRKVAIITSPTGAVIRDILTISANRFPATDIVVIPSKVQGADAPQELVGALHLAQKITDVDVIIIARGGGSFEDLSCFNDEKLARAIYECRFPVVSAIGHETDFTIADFVADRRAGTPSAAAEMVFPERKALTNSLQGLKVRLQQAHINQLISKKKYWENLTVRTKTPERLLEDYRIMLDDYSYRVNRSVNNLMVLQREKHTNITFRISDKNPLARIALLSSRLQGARDSLFSHWRLLGESRWMSYAALTGRLEGANPLAILRRGYGIITKIPNEKLICKAEEVAVGEKVKIKLGEGALVARVEEIMKEKQ
ncbi:MAG: exodeoxyribonuclease VII large subunit [Deltaproteobacteria bacterium]|nr:exodeoxyribonuclease VII large subunit [Deltaproteobacteria bacterium]